MELKQDIRNVRGGSPFHEVDHIDDARCTDHGLVSEDGSHGLFHTELWLQGRQKRLNLLPGWKENIITWLFTGSKIREID